MVFRVGLYVLRLGAGWLQARSNAVKLVRFQKAYLDDISKVKCFHVKRCFCSDGFWLVFRSSFSGSLGV